MADKKKKPDDKSSDHISPVEGFDGDLGFDDDHDSSPPRESSSPNQISIDRDYIPHDQTGDSGPDSIGGQPTSENEGTTASDTWVSDDAPQQQADVDSGSAENDPSKTWVPSSTPTTSGIDSPIHSEESSEKPGSEQIDDPNKTWVPSVDPTFDGSEAPPIDDAGKTWVPPVPPAANGTDSFASQDSPPADASSLQDADKTWVPSETPTVDGIDDSEVQDVDKTWVPSATPTDHEYSFEESSESPAEGHDPNSTWVPSDTPTADGVGSPTANNTADDDAADLTSMTMAIPDQQPGNVTGSGTVVMDHNDNENGDGGSGAPDITTSGTVIVDTNPAEDVFGKTIGMRDLASEEDDQWPSDDGTDTAVLDIPQEISNSGSNRATQIWSIESGDGLSSALTIRNAPVVGDSSFVDSLAAGQPDYEIIKKLAEGGMGAVYIAKQTSLGRELAIKTLKPLGANQKKTYQAQGRISQVENQRREMFLSEALVTGNLVHPHIIPIHDLCQTGDGSPFYSMKRVHGTPWNETIQELSLEENLEILLKVCDAMAYAHHNGVVNRDLKPENVMLGEFGEVLVLDWGLAVPATKADRGKFTSPAAPFGAGTPAYMSPELWSGPAETIGTWSDIYLLGAILFEAITGEAPHEFPEPDSSAGNTGLWMIIDKVVRQNAIRETEHTGELMDIALKAMNSSSKQRHATVLEFQESIKAFQKHEESRRLTERAGQAVSGASPTSQKQGYQSYQTAAALFEEATVAWPENTEARDGLRQARFDYASLAHTKGDYDLGLQVADQEQGAEFQQLTEKLKKSRSVRNGLKKVTVTALGLIIAVGAFAAYQAVTITQKNREITSLYGDKETLQAQTAQAESQKQQAQIAKRQAEADRLVAENAKAEAEVARVDAFKQKEEAESARQVADQLKTEAEQKRLLAEKEKAEATRQLAFVNVEIEKAEKQKIRAGVELTNARIASRIRNANYSGALRGIKELLSSFETNPELARLPKKERDEKIRELQAQQRQLQQRARPTDAPIQAQAIGDSGRVVVWGDSNGKLTVWMKETGVSELPETPAYTKELDAAVSTISISEDGSTIVAAAGSTLYVWIPVEQKLSTLDEHGSRISTLRMNDRYLLSADTGGNIFGWNINQRKRLWSIRSSSAIRDLELMPDSEMFLYAGSRGGQSADVLAYQLPSESDPSARPTRLGQLRLPRNRNNPPLQIAVSPDETLLVISNSRNGEIIVLPRRKNQQTTGRDQFPFMHATDLQEEGNTNWVSTHHQRPVNDIVFSSDGTRLVTASDDRSVGVWNLSDDGSLEFMERLEGHGAKVNSAGFLDQAGNVVLSASADNFCRFWMVDRYKRDQRNIERVFNLDALESGLLDESQRRLSRSFPYRPDQGRLNSAIAAHTKAGDTQSAILAHRQLSIQVPATQGFAGYGLPFECNFRFGHTTARDTSPWITTGMRSRNREAAKGSDHVVLNAGSEVQRGSLNSIVLNKSGTRVITGAADGTAVIWDSKSGQQIKGVSTRTNYGPEKGAFDEGHAFNVARLQFLPPSGKVMITTGFDGTLCLWNADTNASSAGRQEIRIPGLGLVNAVATSPDGKLIVTSAAATEDSKRGGSAIVWESSSLLDDANAEPLTTLTGFHRSEVSALAVNEDSTLVATGARDGRVAVWNISTGQRIAGGQIHVKDTIVSHLDWIADDSLLTAGFDGQIQIVRPDSAASLLSGPSATKPGRLRIERTFQHDRIPVERIAVAPGQQKFATISVRTDRATKRVTSELELWDLTTGVKSHRIRPAVVEGRQPDRIVAIDWSEDGTRLAAVVDGNIQVFDSSSWKIATVLDAPGLGISDAVFAPSGIAAGNSDNIIATFDGTAAHLWDLQDRSHVADFRPLFAVQSTALLEHEQTSLLLTGDRAIRVFNAGEANEEFGQTVSKISDPHKGVVTAICFSPISDGHQHHFVSSGADGSVALWIWDLKTQDATLVRRLHKGKDSVKSVSWHKQGSQVLLAEESGTLFLIDINLQNAPVQFSVLASGDVSIARAEFSADGNFVAVVGQVVSSGESTGWVYDVFGDETPELHCTINGGHEAGGIRDIAFLPDSSYLVTAGADGAALIWNWLPSRADEGPLAAYEAYQLLAKDSSQAHKAAINSVAASASGLIATACEDGTAIIWKKPF